jgi:hypothetical protein
MKADAGRWNVDIDRLLSFVVLIHEVTCAPAVVLSVSHSAALKIEELLKSWLGITHQTRLLSRIVCK